MAVPLALGRRRRRPEPRPLLLPAPLPEEEDLRGVGRALKRLLLPASALGACAAAALCYRLFITHVPAAPDLPAGRPLASPSDLAAPAAFLSGGRGEVEVRDGGGRLPFAEVLRVRTLSKPARPYDVQLRVPTAAPVRAGDALLARFYVRRPLGAPARARTDFVFEEAGGSYKHSVVFPVEAGLRWRRVDVPFRSAGSYAAGGAQANFRAGFGPQTIELGGFELVNRGSLDGPDPVATVGAYAGREAGAAWRRSAERRIERIRKADLVVKVLGPGGAPVPGARVSLRLKRHAFAFGSALDSEILLGAGTDRKKYREAFLRLFNSATIENSLKWPYWKGDRRTRADATAAWLAANGLRLRGHALVWPGWEHMPEGSSRLTPEALRTAVRGHVAEEAAHFRGRAAQWDVVNEPLHQKDALTRLGEPEAGAWLRAARAADPGAKLFVNEYGILDEFGAESQVQDDYEAFIRQLIGRGVPLDGIGLQSHFRWDLTPPERVLAILDRFAALGLPLEATELDIDVTDEALQADYLRDVMIALFSHPAVSGITLWGFWEGVHGDAAPALYRKDWTPKPAGAALEDLLLKRWRTELDGVADGRGEFRARGFLGDYELRAEAVGASGAGAMLVPKEGASVTLQLTPD